MDIRTWDMVVSEHLPIEKSQLLQENEVVADTKPAIDKILKAKCRIIINSCEAMEDRVNYKGRLVWEVIYISQGDKGVYSLNGECQVNDFATLEGARADMSCRVWGEISNVDYNILNDRKVSLSAMADIYATAWSDREIEAIEEVIDLPQQKQKKQSLKYSKT